MEEEVENPETSSSHNGHSVRREKIENVLDQVKSLLQVGNPAVSARMHMNANKRHLGLGTSPVKLRKGSYSVDVTLNTQLHVRESSDYNWPSNSHSLSRRTNLPSPISRMISAAASKQADKRRAARMWTCVKNLILSAGAMRGLRDRNLTAEELEAIIQRRRDQINKLFSGDEEDRMRSVLLDFDKQLYAPAAGPEAPEDPLSATSKLLQDLEKGMLHGHYAEVDQISNKLALESLKSVQLGLTHSKAPHNEEHPLHQHVSGITRYWVDLLHRSDPESDKSLHVKYSTKKDKVREMRTVVAAVHRMHKSNVLEEPPPRWQHALTRSTRVARRYTSERRLSLPKMVRRASSPEVGTVLPRI